MTRVRNISPGPRTFHTGKDDGPKKEIMLDPGKSWEGDVPQSTLDGFKRRAENLGPNERPEFEVDGPEDGAAEEGDMIADEFEAMDDAQLREFITNRDGKAPANNASRETLLKKARG